MQTQEILSAPVNETVKKNISITEHLEKLETRLQKQYKKITVLKFQLKQEQLLAKTIKLQTRLEKQEERRQLKQQKAYEKAQKILMRDFTKQQKVKAKEQAKQAKKQQKLVAKQQKQELEEILIDNQQENIVQVQKLCEAVQEFIEFSKEIESEEVFIIEEIQQEEQKVQEVQQEEDNEIDQMLILVKEALNDELDGLNINFEGKKDSLVNDAIIQMKNNKKYQDLIVDNTQFLIKLFVAKIKNQLDPYFDSFTLDLEELYPNNTNIIQIFRDQFVQNQDVKIDDDILDWLIDNNISEEDCVSYIFRYSQNDKTFLTSQICCELCEEKSEQYLHCLKCAKRLCDPCLQKIKTSTRNCPFCRYKNNEIYGEFQQYVVQVHDDLVGEFRMIQNSMEQEQQAIIDRYGQTYTDPQIFEDIPADERMEMLNAILYRVVDLKKQEIEEEIINPDNLSEFIRYYTSKIPRNQVEANMMFWKSTTLLNEFIKDEGGKLTSLYFIYQSQNPYKLTTLTMKTFLNYMIYSRKFINDLTVFVELMKQSKKLNLRNYKEKIQQYVSDNFRSDQNASLLERNYNAANYVTNEFLKNTTQMFIHATYPKVKF